MEKQTETTAADRDFQNLVRAARVWAETHMDQWEMFKFESRHGTIYVSIALEAPYPDSFDSVPDELIESADPVIPSPNSSAT